MDVSRDTRLSSTTQWCSPSCSCWLASERSGCWSNKSKSSPESSSSEMKSREWKTLIESRIMNSRLDNWVIYYSVITSREMAEWKMNWNGREEYRVKMKVLAGCFRDRWMFVEWISHLAKSFHYSLASLAYRSIFRMASMMCCYFVGMWNLKGFLEYGVLPKTMLWKDSPGGRLALLCCGLLIMHNYHSRTIRQSC